MEIQRGPDGAEIITMSSEEYDDLVDGARHDAAMRAIAAGFIETIADEDMDAFLAAPTPLAFWRKRRKLTQQELAAAIDVSQPYIAQLENGQRDATAAVYVRLARHLKIRLEDLIPNPQTRA